MTFWIVVFGLDMSPLVRDIKSANAVRPTSNRTMSIKYPCQWGIIVCIKIGSLLGALLALISASPSMAACYGRTGAQPQTRFVLRGGEALDSKTGLVWQRCSLGMTWDGERGCQGERMSVGLD